MTRYVVMTVELWERLTIDAPLLPVPQFNVSHERLPGCGYLPVSTHARKPSASTRQTGSARAAC